MRAWSFAAGLGMVATVAVLAFASDPVNPRVVPDNHLTPGQVASTDESDVCGIVGGLSYSKRHRQTSEELKDQVMRNYGMSSRRGYEIDHRVALAIGGADAAENLWPQSYTGCPWNAHVKDDLEVFLWKSVCHQHTMALADAQAVLLGDWRDGYAKYIGPPPSCNAQGRENSRR